MGEALESEPRTHDEPEPYPRVGRALVIGAVSRDRVRVRTASGEVHVATLAAAGYVDPREGDGVVVAVGANETFVVGVLGRARLRSPLPLESDDDPDVSSAPETQPGGDSRVLSRDADGVVRLAGGDVRLEVTEGALELVARDGLHVRTAQGVAITADTIETHARRADLHVEDSRLIGRAVTTVVQTVSVVAERVETEAGLVVERAKSAYREIEDVAQTRAGRIRAIARGALSLFGRDVSLVAEEDAKVDGNKVLLG